MKIEWLVPDLTSVGFPDRAERAILGLILAGQLCLPIQAVFVVREPFRDVGISS